MRFLAHENFPGAAVSLLRSAGHDVAWVRTLAPGINDREVLSWAIRDERVLLTFDKDFGELARVSALPSTSGVVLFRIPMSGPGAIGRKLADVIDARSDWPGHFAVVEPGRVRMRALAPGVERR